MDLYAIEADVATLLSESTNRWRAKIDRPDVDFSPGSNTTAAITAYKRSGSGICEGAVGCTIHETYYGDGDRNIWMPIERRIDISSTAYGSQFDNASRRVVIDHEVGHALGLDHWGCVSSPNTIMTDVTIPAGGSKFRACSGATAPTSFDEASMDQYNHGGYYQPVGNYGTQCGGSVCFEWESYTHHDWMAVTQFLTWIPGETGWTETAVLADLDNTFRHELNNNIGIIDSFDAGAYGRSGAYVLECRFPMVAVNSEYTDWGDSVECFGAGTKDP